jgi:hypothetical protein
MLLSDGRRIISNFKAVSLHFLQNLTQEDLNTQRNCSIVTAHIAKRLETLEYTSLGGDVINT